MFKVYKLYKGLDKTKTPFYIGYTGAELESRLVGHYKDCATKALSSYKINTFRLLQTKCIPVKIELIRSFNTKQEALDFEIRVIRYYRNKGVHLTNTTIGGEGWIKYRVKVFTLDGTLIEIMNSCQAVADKYKCSESKVSSICNGKKFAKTIRNTYTFRKEIDDFDKYTIVRSKSLWSKEAKLRRSIRLKGKEGNRKRIRSISQYTLGGIFVKTWEDSKQICEYYNLKNITPVLRVIKNERNSFKNHIWKIN